jgi:hypothetical protein
MKDLGCGSMSVAARAERILASSPDEMEMLRTWVRSGGILELEGIAARHAARVLVGGGVAEGDSMPLGLGSVRLAAAADRPVEPALAALPSVLESAEQVAREGIPTRVHSLWPVGRRLLLYAGVVLLGALLAFPSGRGRRVAAVSLVAVFSAWPFVQARISWAPVDTARVELVIRTDEQPPVVLTATALRSNVRGPFDVPVLAPTWCVRRTEAASSEASVSDRKGRFDLVRGESVLLSWVGADRRGTVAAQVAIRAGRLVGTVRNDTTSSWANAWVIVLGHRAHGLGELRAGETRVVDAPAVAAADGDTEWTAVIAELPRDRLRLFSSTAEYALRPLVARTECVVVAWSGRGQHETFWLATAESVA